MPHMTAPGSGLTPGWDTRTPKTEVTIIHVGAVEVVCCADGSVRVRHGLDGPQPVRVTRDGPAGFRTEDTVAGPHDVRVLLAPVTATTNGS